MEFLVDFPKNFNFVEFLVFFKLSLKKNLKFFQKKLNFLFLSHSYSELEPQLHLFRKNKATFRQKKPLWKKAALEKSRFWKKALLGKMMPLWENKAISGKMPHFRKNNRWNLLSTQLKVALLFWKWLLFPKRGFYRKFNFFVSPSKLRKKPL